MTATTANSELLDWRNRHAFGWPEGSIRAILALIIFGAIWTWLALRPMSEVPPYLQNLMFIIMGHYFAARGRSAKDGSPRPLYLPIGTVRTMLFAGCFAVAGLLFYRRHVYSNDGV